LEDYTGIEYNATCLVLVVKNNASDPIVDSDYVVLGTPFFASYYITMNYSTLQITITSQVDDSKSFSSLVIAGIVIGTLSGFILLCCGIYWCMNAKSKNVDKYDRLFEEIKD
jgi:hypothetical protein